MKNWKNWAVILLFLLLICSFWIIWEKYPKEIVKVEIRDNERKTDSLMLIIGVKSLVIDSLKKQKDKVKERVIVKVEKLKTLPPDSTIQFFYDGIQAYGEIESERPVLSEDSSVICSLDNLRGASIVMSKYEGEVEKNNIYRNIVALESEIIEDKDSMINEGSNILAKTKDIYNSKIDELNSQLKKEILKKKIATYGGSVLIGVLGGIIIFGR